MLPESQESILWHFEKFGKCLFNSEFRAVVRFSKRSARRLGELDTHDLVQNERALKVEGRLVSIYTAANGIRFYIITEANRSATTILLPEDY